MKSAIILGATGLTGGILLHELLKDSRYGKIKLFSRSTAGVKHEKIEEHLVDLFNLEENREIFKADDVFVCIGTTKNKTPDEETYKKIDFGIPVMAAKLSRENGVKTFAVISALGANANSSMFYNRIKGEMEEEILSQKIPHTYIFQPSLISGDRKEKRVWENLAKQVMKVINPVLVGPLEKYRSINPAIIAQAMIIVANKKLDQQIITSEEIKKIVKSEN